MEACSGRPVREDIVGSLEEGTFLAGASDVLSSSEPFCSDLNAANIPAGDGGSLDQLTLLPTRREAA